MSDKAPNAFEGLYAEIEGLYAANKAFAILAEKQSAEIAALTARAEQAERERDAAVNSLVGVRLDHERAIKKLNELRVKDNRAILRLRAAVAPFAEAAKKYRPYADELATGVVDYPFKLDDLRQAHAAYHEQGSRDGGGTMAVPEDRAGGTMAPNATQPVRSSKPSIS